jgi:hypothetical protein
LQRPPCSATFSARRHCGMAATTHRTALRTRKVDFGFFRKTSTELCEAILQPDETAAETMLRQFLARIDYARLKCALTSAIGADRPEHTSGKPRSGFDNAIWRGLHSRHEVQR